MPTLHLDLQHCFPISAASAKVYEEKGDALLEMVNRQMAMLPAIRTLIGQNDLGVMYTNHRNHLAFMRSVFTLNQAGLLEKTIPWVYRAYSAHGFSFDYFPTVLQAWMQAIAAIIPGDLAQPLLRVYRWMLATHDEMVVASQRPDDGVSSEVATRWQPVQRRFLRALLEGDHRACLDMAMEQAHTIEEIGAFFTQVMQPALYEIGRLWERNEISVAHEHLASSIVGRVMTALYLDVKGIEGQRGTAVVTAAPEEFHQLGAWMLADLLELEGWRVRYLGANTPAQDVVNLVRQERPSLLCLSVTMPFNLDAAQSLMAQIREVPHLITKVMIGGAVFNTHPDLVEHVGADGHAPDAVSAVKLANDWWDGDLKWKVM